MVVHTLLLQAAADCVQRGANFLCRLRVNSVVDEVKDHFQTAAGFFLKEVNLSYHNRDL